MTTDDSLQQGIAASKEGRKDEARALFIEAIKQDQANEQAWLWMSGVAETDIERRTCLQRVLALNPSNVAAQRGLEHLTTKPPSPGAGQLPQEKEEAETPPPPEPESPPKPIQPMGLKRLDHSQPLPVSEPAAESEDEPWTPSSDPLLAGMMAGAAAGAAPPDAPPEPDWLPASDSFHSQELQATESTQAEPEEEFWTPLTDPTLTPSEPLEIGLPLPPPSAGSQAAEGMDPPPAVAPVDTASEKQDEKIPWYLWALVAGIVAIFGCVLIGAILQSVGSGGQGADAQPTDSNTMVKNVVYNNIAAHNAEDADGYLETLHSKAKNRMLTRTVLNQIYRDFDLKHTLSNVELLKVKGDEARVSFVLDTVKISGPDFQNNRIYGVFILRREDGKWKLYDQEVERAVNLP